MISNNMIMKQKLTNIFFHKIRLFWRLIHKEEFLVLHQRCIKVVLNKLDIRRIL